MLEFLKSSLEKSKEKFLTPPRCVVAKNALSPTAIDWINEQFVRSQGKAWGIEWPFIQGPLLSSLEFAKILTKETERKQQRFLVPRTRASLVEVFAELAVLEQKKKLSPQQLLKEMRLQLKLSPLGLLGCDLKSLISDLEERFSQDDSNEDFNTVSQQLLDHLSLRSSLNSKGLRLSDWEWMEAFVGLQTPLNQAPQHLEIYCRLGDDDILENLESQFFNCLNLKIVDLRTLSGVQSPYFWALDAELPGPLALRSFFDSSRDLSLDLLTSAHEDFSEIESHPVHRKKLFISELLKNKDPALVFPEFEKSLSQIKQVGFGYESFKNPQEYIDFLETLEIFRGTPSNKFLKQYDPNLGGLFTSGAPPLLGLTDFAYFPSLKHPVFVCGPRGPEEFLKAGHTGLQWPDPSCLGSFLADEILSSNRIHLPNFKTTFKLLTTRLSQLPSVEKPIFALQNSKPLPPLNENDRLAPLQIPLNSVTRPSRLSPSALEGILRCPLQFGLERRMRLSVSPVDDPLALDPLGAGTWIHAGLENFFKKCQTVTLKNSPEVGLILADCLRQTYAESFRKKPSAEYSKIIEAHIPGLVAALQPALLDFESRVLSGFELAPKQLEFEIQTQIFGSKFLAKLDRIDTLRIDSDDPGGYLIIDYKTGSPPREKPLTQVLNKNFQWFLYVHLLEEFSKIQENHKRVRGGGYFQPLKPHQSCFFVFNSEDPHGKLSRALSDFATRWDCKFYSIDLETETQLKNEIKQNIFTAEKILEGEMLAPKPLKPATCKSCRVSTLCGLPFLNPNFFDKGLATEEAPA